MWALLKTFGLDKAAVKGAIILAAVFGLLAVITVSYMAGKRDESIQQELKRKDAVIEGLKADVKLQKELTMKAEQDRTELAIQTGEDATALNEYKEKLKALEQTKNGNSGVKGQINQCRNVCAIDDDFLGVLSRRRVR